MKVRNNSCYAWWQPVCLVSLGMRAKTLVESSPAERLWKHNCTNCKNVFQEGERLFRAHSHFDIMKGGTQGFPRHDVSDKQEVLFEDVSPSTAFCWRIENAVDGETSSNKTSCLSLTSCLGNPCVPPFIICKKVRDMSGSKRIQMGKKKMALFGQQLYVRHGPMHRYRF